MTHTRLTVTAEQFDRLWIDNPDFRLELTAKGGLIIMPSTGDERGERNLDLACHSWKLSMTNFPIVSQPELDSPLQNHFSVPPFLLHAQFQHLSHPPARRDNLPELDRVQKRARNKWH